MGIIHMCVINFTLFFLHIFVLTENYIYVVVYNVLEVTLFIHFCYKVCYSILTYKFFFYFIFFLCLKGLSRFR